MFPIPPVSVVVRRMKCVLEHSALTRIASFYYANIRLARENRQTTEKKIYRNKTNRQVTMQKYIYVRNNRNKNVIYGRSMPL